ncbi:MAG: transcription antitermination factor NusB [Hahellaceae bacterium]|nr:transcription antitermination factor NusB [Hahellaceae bacterium]MCP5168850.1 transcription antitermination factor NusB [Hahellaceae bacterium]
MSEQSSAEHQGNQPSAAKRRKARTLALQALYQWQLAKSSVSQIEAEFAVDNDMTKVDVPYFREILRGVTMNKSELEAQFAPFLDRPVDDVDPVELSLLRMGAYELMKRVDVPYRVVINEGVELAKKFGGTDGHKFINGILDKMALRLRAAETRHKYRKPDSE